MAIIDNLNQALSVTEVSRSCKSIFDNLASGKQDKYVVMRNNIPAAVMLNVKTYEALIEMFHELSFEQKALERIASFDESKSLSSDQLLESLQNN
jgi:antitoxin StbD